MKKNLHVCFAFIVCAFMFAACSKESESSSAAVKSNPFEMRINASNMDAFNKTMAPFREAFAILPEDKRDEVIQAFKFLAFDAYKNYPKLDSLNKSDLKSLREFDLYSIKKFDGKTINEILTQYKDYKILEGEEDIFEKFNEFLMSPQKN